MAKRPLRAAFVLAAGILIAIGGCTDRHPTVTSEPESGQSYERVELQRPAAGGAYNSAASPVAEKVIGPEGGTLLIPGGHTLNFPAGALSAPTNIRARIDVRYIEVDLGPDGLQFPEGHEPVLKLSYSGSNAGLFRSLAVAYLSESGRILEILTTQDDASTQTLTAKLKHFSRYASVGS